MQSKKTLIKQIVVLTMVVLLVSGGIGTAYADDTEGQTMVYKDGKFIWVDADSAEAEEATRNIKRSERDTAPYEVQAKPTNQKITVDGVPTKFRAYNISGYNYFMLRDLAYIFNGTKAQFEVGWDGGKFAISLETGKPYTGKGEGFDMKAPHVEEKGLKSKATIYKDGEEAILLGYTIQGYTYFKLRDLGDEMGFGVEWDNVNQTVVLQSDKDAPLPTPEPEPTPEPTEVADNEDPFKDYNPFEVEEVDLSKVTGATEREKQQMREEMLVLINKARKKEGVSPLVLDDNLVEMSEYKATDLKKTGVLSHDGSYGSTMDLARMFNEQGIGENALMGGMSAEDMYQRWWNSPGHRANMLNPDYKRIGIGFAEDKPITIARAEVYDDLEELAYKVTYNEPTGLYHITTMTYWAAQNFGF